MQGKAMDWGQVIHVTLIKECGKVAPYRGSRVLPLLVLVLAWMGLLTPDEELEFMRVRKASLEKFKVLTVPEDRERMTELFSGTGVTGVGDPSEDERRGAPPSLYLSNIILDAEGAISRIRDQLRGTKRKWTKEEADDHLMLARGKRAQLETLRREYTF